MKKIFKLLLKIFIWFNLLSLALVIVYSFVPIPFTITMLTRKIQNPDKEIHYTWKSYNEISSNMPLALIASEDQKFPNHDGFDWQGIESAYASNLKGKKMRGGSTISQQVAKNVFLWQHRSYLRKGLEAYYTFLIEIFWSKKRIIEVYMNVSETGICTFGVEEGSQRYFKKSAANLSQREAAEIASVFPSPQKWNVGGGKAKRIVRQMNNLGSSYVKQIE